MTAMFKGTFTPRSKQCIMLILAAKRKKKLVWCLDLVGQVKIFLALS
jgi:hypothetical protein